MTLEFSPLNRKELRQAAELAARAFIDYEYFTNWFPDDKVRARVVMSIVWYVSSLSVDPVMQGIGLGTKLLDYCENYIRERDGRQVVLVTNSQKNLDFYLKRGYELFDEREFEYNGNRMGSWSLKKVLLQID